MEYFTGKIRKANGEILVFLFDLDQPLSNFRELTEGVEAIEISKVTYRGERN